MCFSQTAVLLVLLTVLQTDVLLVLLRVRHVFETAVLLVLVIVRHVIQTAILLALLIVRHVFQTAVAFASVTNSAACVSDRGFASVTNSAACVSDRDFASVTNSAACVSDRGFVIRPSPRARREKAPMRSEGQQQKYGINTRSYTPPVLFLSKPCDFLPRCFCKRSRSHVWLVPASYVLAIDQKRGLEWGTNFNQKTNFSRRCEVGLRCGTPVTLS